MGATIVLFQIQAKLALDKEQLALLEKEEELRVQFKNYSDSLCAHISQLNHDFKHHLQQLAGLAARKNWEEFDEYIKDYTEKHENVASFLVPNSPQMTVLLTHMQQRAQESDVEFECRIEPDKAVLEHISQTDLGSVVSNILDNAILAASQADDETGRKVEFRLTSRNNTMLINCTNTKPQNYIKHKTEKDKIGHGHGVNSIKAIAGSYGGTTIIDNPEGGTTYSILVTMDVKIPETAAIPAAC